MMSESPEQTLQEGLEAGHRLEHGRDEVCDQFSCVLFGTDAALEELIEERDGLKTKVEELETVLATLHKERTAGASY